jgi:hypothetical protein
MTNSLPHIVRAAYTEALKRQRDDTAAYERAVETVLTHWPSLTVQEARREVAMMLSFEPEAEERGR